MSSLTLGLLPAWTGSTPVARLIRHTARAQKRLLTLNIAFALLLSISEAGLFALIYRTVRVLAGSPLPLILKQSGLDRGAVFLILLLGVCLTFPQAQPPRPRSPLGVPIAALSLGPERP
jgi:hypothetical protein